MVARGIFSRGTSKIEIGAVLNSSPECLWWRHFKRVKSFPSYSSRIYTGFILGLFEYFRIILHTVYT